MKMNLLYTGDNRFHVVGSELCRVLQATSLRYSGKSLQSPCATIFAIFMFTTLVRGRLSITFKFATRALENPVLSVLTSATYSPPASALSVYVCSRSERLEAPELVRSNFQAQSSNFSASTSVCTIRSKA